MYFAKQSTKRKSDPDLPTRPALPANLQYVWGLRNVDDLVLRDSNSGGGNLGITGSGLGLRLYALQDANWNVVALVSTSGTVQERFWYTAFGTATALGA